MKETIGEHHNMLVVIGEWENDVNDPIRRRHYWPVGVESRLFSNLIGEEVRYSGMGGGRYYGVNRQSIEVVLKDGGDTKPVYTETQPIPRPKGKTLRYNNGQWERYTRRDGWKMA